MAANEEKDILDLSASDIQVKDIPLPDEIKIEPAPKTRDRNVREGRRTHMDLRDNHSTKTSTRPVHRELEKADAERHDDYTDLDPFASASFLIVPQQYVDKFYDAGWHIQFVHEKDYYGKGRLGFTPVMLDEIPEWSTAGLPSIDSNSDTTRAAICRSIDQILMKIPLAKYDRLTRSVRAQRERVDKIANKFLDNGLNYERGQTPRHSMVIDAPRQNTQNIRERPRS